MGNIWFLYTMYINIAKRVMETNFNSIDEKSVSEKKPAHYYICLRFRENCIHKVLTEKLKAEKNAKFHVTLIII